MDRMDRMDRMNNDSENIELSDPVDSFSISSVVHPECSLVGVSYDPDYLFRFLLQVIFLLTFFKFI